MFTPKFSPQCRCAWGQGVTSATLLGNLNNNAQQIEACSFSAEGTRGWETPGGRPAD